jgi:hypothetical protein
MLFSLEATLGVGKFLKQPDAVWPEQGEVDVGRTARVD